MEQTDRRWRGHNNMFIRTHKLLMSPLISSAMAHSSVSFATLNTDPMTFIVARCESHLIGKLLRSLYFLRLCVLELQDLLTLRCCCCALHVQPVQKSAEELKRQQERDAEERNKTIASRVPQLSIDGLDKGNCCLHKTEKRA